MEIIRKPIIKESEIIEIQQLIICHQAGDELLKYAFDKCYGIEVRETHNLTFTEYKEVKNIADYMFIYDLIDIFTRAKQTWKYISEQFKNVGFEVIENISNLSNKE